MMLPIVKICFASRFISFTLLSFSLIATWTLVCSHNPDGFVYTAPFEAEQFLVVNAHRDEIMLPMYRHNPRPSNSKQSSEVLNTATQSCEFNGESYDDGSEWRDACYNLCQCHAGTVSCSDKIWCGLQSCTVSEQSDEDTCPEQQTCETLNECVIGEACHDDFCLLANMTTPLPEGFDNICSEDDDADSDTCTRLDVVIEVDKLQNQSVGVSVESVCRELRSLEALRIFSDSAVMDQIVITCHLDVDEETGSGNIDDIPASMNVNFMTFGNISSLAVRESIIRYLLQNDAEDDVLMYVPAMKPHIPDDRVFPCMEGIIYHAPGDTWPIPNDPCGNRHMCSNGTITQSEVWCGSQSCQVGSDDCGGEGEHCQGVECLTGEDDCSTNGYCVSTEGEVPLPESFEKQTDAELRVYIELGKIQGSGVSLEDICAEIRGLEAVRNFAFQSTVIVICSLATSTQQPPVTEQSVTTSAAPTTTEASVVTEEGDNGEASRNHFIVKRDTTDFIEVIVEILTDNEQVQASDIKQSITQALKDPDVISDTLYLTAVVPIEQPDNQNPANLTSTQLGLIIGAAVILFLIALVSTGILVRHCHKQRSSRKVLHENNSQITTRVDIDEHPIIHHKDARSKFNSPVVNRGYEDQDEEGSSVMANRRDVGAAFRSASFTDNHYQGGEPTRQSPVNTSTVPNGRMVGGAVEMSEFVNQHATEAKYDNNRLNRPVEPHQPSPRGRDGLLQQAPSHTWYGPNDYGSSPIVTGAAVHQAPRRDQSNKPATYANLYDQQPRAGDMYNRISTSNPRFSSNSTSYYMSGSDLYYTGGEAAATTAATRETSRHNNDVQFAAAARPVSQRKDVPLASRSNRESADMYYYYGQDGMDLNADRNARGRDSYIWPEGHTRF